MTWEPEGGWARTPPAPLLRLLTVSVYEDIPKRDIEDGVNVYRGCRLVATLPIVGDWDELIFFYEDDFDDQTFFLVSDRPSRKPQRFTTLRKAFSQACKNGGWG